MSTPANEITGTFTGTFAGPVAAGPTGPAGPQGPTGPAGSGGNAGPPVLFAPTTATFTDASGNVWGISGGQVTLGGVADTTTANVEILTYIFGTIWQMNSANFWYGKTSPTAAWSAGTTTSPLTGTLGPTGPAGATGPTGPAGGPTGPQGPQGVPGSAPTLSTHTANYTLTLADAGTFVRMNGTNLILTIPANVAVPFPVPTLITVINASATPLSIGIVTDTLALADSAETGVRTVAAMGIANLVLHAVGEWLISGAGVK